MFLTGYFFLRENKEKNVLEMYYKMSKPLISNAHFTWTLKDLPKKFDRKIVEYELEKAFSTWQMYINIKFTQINNHKEKDKSFHIEIGFYPKEHKQCANNSFDGVSGILAHSTYPSFANELFIHFDSDEEWLFDNVISFSNFFSNRPVFFNVALHEIGHVLGLVHSDDISSIMYKTYSRFINFPSGKDIKKLQEIYGAKTSIIPDDNNMFITLAKVYYKEFSLVSCLLFFILLSMIFKK